MYLSLFFDALERVLCSGQSLADAGPGANQEAGPFLILHTDL